MKSSWLITSCQKSMPAARANFNWRAFGSTLFAQTSDLDPRVVKLVESISEERLSNLLRKLQSRTA